MPNSETYIVTLFEDQTRSDEPWGRVRHVITSKEAHFRNLAELAELLRHFPTDDPTDQPDLDTTRNQFTEEGDHHA